MLFAVRDCLGHAVNLRSAEVYWNKWVDQGLMSGMQSWQAIFLGVMDLMYDIVF